MIDTIVFSLYIGKFPNEVRSNILNNWKKTESFNIENTRGIYFNHLEKVFTKKNMHFDIHLPSSHYKMHCDLDDIRKEIKFNFSIPKFYYGQNLMPSFYHSKFNQNIVYNQIPTKEIVKLQWKMIVNAMFESCNFLCSEIIPIDVLMKNIKIFRIDVCKNYLFETEEHCKEYLNNLRKIQIPYKSLASPRLYESTMLWVFDNYSIKAYQKGAEIKKDFDKLDNYTKEEIKYLKTLANRTLRYEVTIRTQKLKDLFLDTFRKEESIFLNLDDEIKAKFKKRNLTIQHCRTEYFKKTSENELNSCYKYGKPNKKFEAESHFEPIFDIETLSRCINFAEEKFKFLQNDPMPSFIEIRKSIKEGNEYLEYIGEKKIGVEPVIKIIKLLQTNSFAELIEQKVISRQTKYNFLKKFQRLGLKIKINNFCNNLENNDKDGELFMLEINQIADKCLQLTNNHSPYLDNF